MIRVLHVIAPGPIAGAERVVLAGVQALQAAGTSVRLSAFVDSRSQAQGDAFLAEAARLGIRDTVALPCSARFDTRLVRSLASSFARDGWDIVHAHGYKALSYCIAARAMSTASPPIVVTHHGETAASPAVRLYEHVARALYKGTARVFAVCDAAAAELVARGVKTQVLAVVRNPCILPQPANPPAVGDHLRLVFAGRLVPEKGVDVLLEALRDPRLSTVHLEVLGEGHDRARLERLAKAHGPRVHFAGWTDDVGRHLAAAHALVLPSLREGLPMVILEALAIGRSVIASDVGGIREVVENHVTGLLVPPKKPDALASAIHAFAQDRLGFNARVATAADDLRARFSPARWADETLSEYEAVLRMSLLPAPRVARGHA